MGNGGTAKWGNGHDFAALKLYYHYTGQENLNYENKTRCGRDFGYFCLR